MCPNTPSRYPTSWVGKLLATFVILSGILVIALPITVIGSNFSTVYKRQMAQDAQV
mgnify:CR=1 FL=1